MTRPLLEVADIVRTQGDRFIQNNFRWIHWAHRKVLRAIARCRTASLGGHRDQCPRCGYRAISYNLPIFVLFPGFTSQDNPGNGEDPIQLLTMATM